MSTKLKSIRLKTQMVHAILEGRKTMHRINLVSDNESIMNQPRIICSGITDLGQMAHFRREGNLVDFAGYKFPYGKVGDVIWVKETFQYRFNDINQVGYKADFIDEPKLMDKIIWKPSIHMPFAACRIFLRITDIRVERLKDISEQDAIKEGIEQQNGKWRNYFNPTGVEKFDFKDELPVISFMSLWAAINGIDSWIANPWVWVISFERCEKPTA